ncbi:uncharacterized protein LOC101845440 [Aplysia californica]|uniref:Uncharacterized protein LOC101845440 n=1 Tax=Aplysia californica TaxID=6500 RepID=A0ABM1W3X0_APLCA|nr:uncharacterized protein LOC101845440 [Aplysia californica]
MGNYLGPHEDTSLDWNNNNDQTLTCRSESSLGQTGPSISKTVKFAYGPSSATLTFSPTNPSSLCQGTSLSVVSTCAVDQSTVNPQPDYKISVNGVQVGTSVQQTLQLQGGTHNVSCRVENWLFPADLFTDVAETFTVRIPPPDPPEITVSQPLVLSTGEILVKDNVATSVRCVVRGGYPATIDVSLSCPSSQPGSSDVSSVVVTRSQGTQCSCTATHDSGCYNKRSDVTIKAAYGPEGVTLERKNVRLEETGTYNLCPSATSDIIMECSVGVVYPAASFRLTMTPTGTKTADACTGNNKCSYEIVPSRGGNHKFWCVAVNSAFGDMSGDSPFVQVYVREPPKHAPKLTINGKYFTGVTADNSVVFVDGQENSMVCRVDGGFPEVSPSDIYVQCDGVNVTDGKVVFTPYLNATYCTCRARHTSGCYDLSTEVLVIVIFLNETVGEQSGDQTTIAAAVGAACATLVLCCVTTAVVYWFLKRKGCFRWMAKPIEEQSGITRDNNVGREDSQYEDVDLDMSLQDNSTLGHREESLYVDVDSDHISSQDIHTPVLNGKTVAVIVTQTDGDERRFNNTSVTSSVSTTKQEERSKENQYVDADMVLINAKKANTQIVIGKTTSINNKSNTPQADCDDGRRYNNVSLTSPESELYVSCDPEVEYFNLKIDEEMDGNNCPPRNSSSIKEIM